MIDKFLYSIYLFLSEKECPAVCLLVERRRRGDIVMNSDRSSWLLNFNILSAYPAGEKSAYTYYADVLTSSVFFISTIIMHWPCLII